MMDADAPSSAKGDVIEVRVVTYCTRQLLAILGVFGAVCFFMAAIGSGYVVVLVLACGAFAYLSAVALTAYVIFIRPDLLQTQRNESRISPERFRADGIGGTRNG